MATATLNGTTAQNTKTITLKTATTFICLADPDRMDLELQPGETCSYERIETDDETIHIAYIMDYGVRFESIKRIPKMTTPAPVVATTLPVSVPEPIVQPALIAPPVVAPVVQAIPPVAPVANPALPSPTIQAALNATAQAARVCAERIAERANMSTDQVEKRIRELDRVVKILRGKVYQVNYYIPARNKGMSPCRDFRKAGGCYLDGSNCLFDETGLNHALVVAWFDKWADTNAVEEERMGYVITKKIRWWANELTNDQIAVMRDNVLDQLCIEMQELHLSLLERIESADKSLEEALEAADSSKDQDKANNSFNGTLRDIIRSAQETFHSCLKGAELFDDTGCLDALFTAVRDAIKTQALSVNATLRARRVKQVDVTV